MKKPILPPEETEVVQVTNGWLDPEFDAFDHRPEALGVFVPLEELGDIDVGNPY